MQTIQTFDPTAQTSGQFPLHLVNGGWLVLTNESTIGLILTFGDGSKKIVNPFTVRAMRVTNTQASCDWQQYYSITGANAPQGLSIVTGEAYDPQEWTGGEFILALPRLVNVGNGVPGGGGTTASVTNDGNVAGTVVVEATASGSASSNVLIDNDGTMHIKVISNGVLTEVLAIVPGGATTPASVTIHGTADKVPASGVTPGNFPTGVFTMQSPANGAGSPDTLVVTNGDRTQNMVFGVSKAGDAVNAPGAYIFDTVTNSFLVKGGLLNTRYGGAISGLRFITGAGSGTFNHNMGVTPVGIIVTPNSGVDSSYTVGVDHITATQFHVNIGGDQAVPWAAIAFA